MLNFSDPLVLSILNVVCCQFAESKESIVMRLISSKLYKSIGR